MTKVKNIAALLCYIPAFISALAEFDLNSLIVLVFPQILLELCTWPTTHQQVGRGEGVAAVGRDSGGWGMRSSWAW